MKRTIPLIIFLIFIQHFAFAKIWETASYGLWSEASVWIGNEVPPYVSGDTFIINHPIAIFEDIVFESEADIKIGIEGGLCGHQIMTLNDNALLINTGLIQLDELYIYNGHISVPTGGIFKLTTSASILGGSMAVVGGSMAVGVWIECTMPTFSFLMTTSQETVQTSAIHIYPNPVTEYLTIELPDNTSDVELTVFDPRGSVVWSEKYDGGDSVELDFSNRDRGFYFLLLRDGGTRSYYKVFKR